MSPGPQSNLMCQEVANAASESRRADLSLRRVTWFADAKRFLQSLALLAE